LKFLIGILAFIFPVISSAQTDSIKCNSIFDTLTKTEVYTFVDKMPEVVGGMEALFKEFQNIKYPNDGADYGGKVFVAFIIDIDGKLIGKRIIHDPSGDKFGKQILMLIDNVKWQPGSCNGKNVPVIFILPVYIEFE